MLTIVLSGPRISEQQARTALASRGYNVQKDNDARGLTDTVSGEPIREAQSFVTVQAEDVDAVRESVVSLGWTLRMHHDTPEAAPPNATARLAATVAEMRADIADLKARVGA